MNESEKVKYLWSVIDKIHSMVWDKKKMMFVELTDTEKHILELVQNAMIEVSYPGEPENAEVEEIEED